MSRKITGVDAYCVKLPYRKAVSFRGTKNEQAGQYVILRISLDDGTEGIAESNTRATQNGEDAATVAYRIATFFKPRLLGLDPLHTDQIAGELDKTKHCRTEKALIDVAMWDLKGKILGLPVWKLLGGGPVEPIPLTWIAHGNTTDAMIEEACRMVLERGFKALKLKVWKKSEEDLRMVREIRAKVGPSVPIYCDANGVYTETEARVILSRLHEYDVLFIEEPCKFVDSRRAAEMARRLKPAMLGDQTCETIAEVAHNITMGSVGAVSVKLRRTGFTESLKIISLCEAFGIPVLIGTDSESRIGSQARFHLRAGVSYLRPWPMETHFFEKLADDPFAGQFLVENGEARPGDAPGFGAGLDWDKMREFALPGGSDIFAR
jgi:L-alanine-DL-glutamate epimerase-like enolase superfamily enzyme